MKYWLMKSEPDVFSIDDLQKAKLKGTLWEGVRNYQARNYMRDEMRVGDQILYYHSSCQTPGIVGVAEVASNSMPDATCYDPKSEYFDPKSSKENPRWFLVKVIFKQKFNQVLTLNHLREEEKLKDLKILQKGNRLSITPIEEKEFKHILKLV